MSSVFIAIKGDQLEMLKLLRKYGADLEREATVGKGETIKPILMACKCASKPVVEYVL